MRSKIENNFLEINYNLDFEKYDDFFGAFIQIFNNYLVFDQNYVEFGFKPRISQSF